MGTKYKGTFSVKNASGETLDYVKVKHHAEYVLQINYRENTTLEAKSLEPGASIQGGVLNAETGVPDLWDVEFSVMRPAWGGGGNVQVWYSRRNKGCDYEPEDAPKNCEIELTVGSFSIKMPVSSSCLDNYIRRS